MAGKMNRRKCYLDPGCDVTDIPKSTQSYIKPVHSHLTVTTKRDDSEGSRSVLATALAISATATGNSRDENGNRETPVVLEIFDADITDTKTSDASTNSVPGNILSPQVVSRMFDAAITDPETSDSASTNSPPGDILSPQVSCENMDSENCQPTALEPSSDLSVRQFRSDSEIRPRLWTAMERNRSSAKTYSAHT